MNERPKIKLELTTIDKALEILGWTSILTLWVLIITNYNSMPDEIPIHWNLAGKADRFGDKVYILPFSIVPTVLFFGLTILNEYPHVFNYPTDITEENALSQYRNATRLIRYLKFIIVVIFQLMALETISYVNGDKGFGIWFQPMMALFFTPLLYFVIRSFKMAKK